MFFGRHWFSESRCRVNFSERAPSSEWAAVVYKREKIAEAWFKPQGEPFALMFRIPQKSFQNSDVSQRLTIGNLLKTAAVSTEEVESWHLESDAPTSGDGTSPNLGHPLPPPPREAA